MSQSPSVITPNTAPVQPPASTVETSDHGLGLRPRPRLRHLVLSTSPATWACLDALLIGVAALVTQILLTTVASSFGWLASPWLTSAAFCVCILVGGLVFGLYERDILFSRSVIIVRSILALSLGVVLAFALLSVFFYAGSSRWVGLGVALVYLATSLPIRLKAHEVIYASRSRVLCVGGGESVRKLVRTLQDNRHRNYQVVGHVRPDQVPHHPIMTTQIPEQSPRFRSDDDAAFERTCPQVGALDDLPHLIEAHGIDEVVVASELASHPTVGAAVAACLEARCRVTNQTTFVEKLQGEVPAETISVEWFLQADVQNHGGYEAIKRLMDMLLSGIGLLFMIPLAPLLIALIRLDSRGPALFKQVRVGQFGRCFTMYKFRTMRTDAEDNGARWAKQNDDRVTRIGRFLRRSRLDELPQLWNIFCGDMSLVGPRPERPEFVHNLEQILPHYRLRHLVKPGLSGWAQIHYRYGASISDTHRKLCYDLYYLKHRSLDLDVAIIIRTLGTFVLGAR